MKRYILLLFLPILTSSLCMADINTEKAISKISRDTRTYLSGEGRAETEQKAYEMALDELLSKISDYYKTEFPSEPMPENVYLSNLSSIFERLTSQVNSNRYRVLVYVRKSEIKALGDGKGTVLSRRDSDSYEVIPAVPLPAEPIIITDTVTVETVRTVIKPLHPALSTISNLKTRDEVLVKVPELKHADLIESGATFPVHSLDDFYIIIISPGNEVVTVLHCDGKDYTDVMTGEAVDMSRYRYCSAFWFTLKN